MKDYLIMIILTQDSSVQNNLLTHLTQICETFEVWLIKQLKEKKNY